MNIHELELASGQPARNIRFLIEQGVMPGPEGTKRWAKYGDEHLAALAVYTKAKSEGVGSLDVIRERIEKAALLGATSSGGVFEVIPGVELKIDDGALGNVGKFVEAVRKLAARIVEKQGEDA